MQKALLAVAAVVFAVLIGFMGYLMFKGDPEKPVAKANDVPPKVVKTTPAPEDAPPAPDPSIPVGTSVGNMAPQISGEDVDGVAFKLSDYRGKVVVLDFWGFW